MGCEWLFVEFLIINYGNRNKNKKAHRERLPNLNGAGIYKQIMLTEENKEEIARLYNEEGMNPEDIAEELDLDEVEVMNYCLEIL